MAKHVIKNDNAERRYKIQKVIRYRTAMETLIRHFDENKITDYSHDKTK